MLFREFILGQNKTGSVLEDGTVIGGEDQKYETGVVRGRKEIYYGDYSKPSTAAWPQATIDAWDTFIAGQRKGQ